MRHYEYRRRYGTLFNAYDYRDSHHYSDYVVSRVPDNHFYKDRGIWKFKWERFYYRDVRTVRGYRIATPWQQRVLNLGQSLGVGPYISRSMFRQLEDIYRS